MTEIPRAKRDIKAETKAFDTLTYVRTGFIFCFTKITPAIPDNYDPDIILPRVSLKFRDDRGRSVSVPLTAFTVQELDVLKDAIDEAFELARPIAEAKDELIDGDTSATPRHPMSRKYRELPKIHRATWAIGKHGQGIWSGFASVARVGRKAGNTQG